MIKMSGGIAVLLSQLRYFQVVAQHEHISRAAEKLHIAQPALSATISKIEKELGVPLFHRQGRNIELNDAGKRLLVHANFMFEQLAAMEESLATTKEILENEFILSVSNSMLLNGWLQQFVLQNPKIHLRQKMLGEDQMITALLDETIDMALGEFETDHPGIIRKTIIEDEYIINIPIQHPLAQKEKIYFEDIREEGIVSLPSNTIFKIVDRIFAQKDCKPNIVFEGNHRMMNKMLRINRGLLFGSRQMMYMRYLYEKEQAASDHDSYAVVMQPIADLNCKCTLSLCWKEGRELPLMAQKFIDAMENQYPNYRNDAEYLQKKELIMPVN